MAERMTIIDKRENLSKMKEKAVSIKDKTGLGTVKGATRTVFGNGESDAAQGYSEFKQDFAPIISLASGVGKYLGSSVQYENGSYKSSEYNGLASYLKEKKYNNLVKTRRFEDLNGHKETTHRLNIKGRNDFKSVKENISNYCKECKIGDITKMSRSELRIALRTNQFGNNNILQDAAKVMLKNGNIDRTVGASRKMAGKNIFKAFTGPLFSPMGDTATGLSICKTVTKSGYLALKTSLKAARAFGTGTRKLASTGWNSLVKRARKDVMSGARTSHNLKVLRRDTQIRRRKYQKDLKKRAKLRRKDNRFFRRAKRKVSALWSAFARTGFGRALSVVVSPFKALLHLLKFVKTLLLKVGAYVGIFLIALAIISTGIGMMFAANEEMDTALCDENGEMITDIQESCLYRVGETLSAYEELWFEEINTLAESGKYTVSELNGGSNITSIYTDINGKSYTISEWGTADSKPVIQHFYNGDPSTDNSEFLNALKKVENSSETSNGKDVAGGETPPEDDINDSENDDSNNELTESEKLMEAKEHLLEAFIPFTDNNYGKEIGKISNIKGILALANAYSHVSSDASFSARLFCEYATSLFRLSHTALPEENDKQGQSMTIPLAENENYVETTWLDNVVDEEKAEKEGIDIVTQQQAKETVLAPQIIENPIGGYTVGINKDSNGEINIYNCESGCVTETYYCNEENAYKHEKTICVIDGGNGSSSLVKKTTDQGGCEKEVTTYTQTTTITKNATTNEQIGETKKPGTKTVEGKAQDANGNTYTSDADGNKFEKLAVNKDAYNNKKYSISYTGKTVKVKNSSGKIVNAKLGVVKYSTKTEYSCPGHTAYLCKGHVDMCTESIIYQYDNVLNNLYSLSCQMALDTSDVDSFGETSYKIAAKYKDFETAKYDELKAYKETADALYNQRWYETYGYDIDYRIGGTGSNMALAEFAKTQEGKPRTSFRSKDGGGFPENWCAAFVSWCLNETGYLDADLAFWHTYADFKIKDNPEELLNRGAIINGPYGENLHSAPLTNTTIPSIGDIVMFDWWDSNTFCISHVGIVVDVTEDEYGYKVTTIEGNTRSGGYMYVTKETYYVGGSGRGKAVKVYVTLKAPS